MTEPSTTRSNHTADAAKLGLVLNGTALIWYGWQLLKYGVDLHFIHVIGGYFILCFLCLAAKLRAEDTGKDGRSFLFLISVLSIFAVVGFTGQFLSTFDTFYRIADRPFAFLVRGVFLGASITTLYVTQPRRFLSTPRWLLALAGVLSICWLFAYGCPSIVREMYGTRSAPSELFPNGLLSLPWKNPERGLQKKLLIATALLWLTVIIVGRIRHTRSPSPEEEASMHPTR